jgi:Macrocin-O-methyltransferase (TylF)
VQSAASLNEEMAIVEYSSGDERRHRQNLLDLLREAPIPDSQLLSNLGLFLESKNLARILFMDFLYRQILDVHGVVMEFGTRWGQNIALFAALRGLYEPFHRHRKLVAFDTFRGFPAVRPEDGASSMMRAGQLAVTDGYAGYLERILSIHEQLSPLGHLRKFELRAGDATVEIDRYLAQSPETIVALAYFDFDLYEPTRECLERIRPRLTRGSVVAFDELNDPDSPGETLALMEVFGLEQVRLRRLPHVARCSYFVVE